MRLSNSKVGRTIAKFRMMRDMKASDLSARIGMKEAAYTKYERGETKMTIDLVQKVADALEIDVLLILTADPDNFIETTNVHCAFPAVGIGDDASTREIHGAVHTAAKPQEELMIKLMQKLIEILGDK